MNNCASAKAVQNPYLNAHINKLIQERNDSLTKIECPKHPNNELQFYDQINSAFVCTDCILQPKKYQIEIVDSVKNMLFENKQHILKSSNDFLSKYEQQIQKLKLTLESLSNNYLQKQEEISLQEGQLIQYIKNCAYDQINQLIDQETRYREIIQKELEVLRVAKVRALMPIIRLRNANEQDLATEVKLEEDIQEIQKCKQEQSKIIDESKLLRLSNEMGKLVLNLGEIMNQQQLSDLYQSYGRIFAKQLSNYIKRRHKKHTDSFSCSICFQLFSSKLSDTHCSMILPECGHTFCKECLLKIQKDNKKLKITCPLDKTFSDCIIPNFYLCSLIEDETNCKLKFRPKCVYNHQKQIQFYEANYQRFYCEECFRDQKRTSSGISLINGLYLISYDALKPKLIENIKNKIDSNCEIDLTQLQYLETPNLQEQQERLVKEQESLKKEALRKITKEFDAKIANIKVNFINDVVKDAIQIKRELIDKQQKENKEFIDKLSEFLEREEIDMKNLNIKLLKGLQLEPMSHEQIEISALQNQLSKYEQAKQSEQKSEKQQDLNSF
ncbi:hypothetical protein FGO68_gene13078 [Halteria grandinella]|uniref:RING-type domain-containing protein n=1 Tax=Halteria grandinella TaxID=5974 RepID=A0A8J8T448_HALGN|nr:hypothetical protein FGO68_gene13078 [Halteria grandinella]